ncbi:MAG: serine kinase [Armatimonadetes bacterium]|jgi:predicted transcriptional regulator|nr:serine kinase [Armatimonadota bacterium]
MRLAQVIEELGLRPLASFCDREVTGGYASDLLSDVLANGREGNVWLTIQAHRNVAAVASLKDFAAVVLTGGRSPQDDLLEVAQQEGVCLLSTPLSTYEAAGKLYALQQRADG